MNKEAFLLTMYDGIQAAANVFGSNAGRPHFTHREGGGFHRICLSPIPSLIALTILQVREPQEPLSKSPHMELQSTENTVGAEYIIMEKGSRCPARLCMGCYRYPKPPRYRQDYCSLPVGVALIRQAWGSVLCRGSGGHGQSPLDTKDDGTTMTDCKSVAGPFTGREFNDVGRVTVERVHVGPVFHL